MTRFRQIFTNKHVVLPVIHVESEEQALRNTMVARESGGDGVFLINHGMSHERLLEIFAVVHAAHPDWWLGVNCLGLPAIDTFNAVASEVAGIWVDNAEIDERAADQPHAESIASARRKAGWEGLYFGGVAFKYQREVKELAVAARISSRYMDVVTTSGPGTGQEAHREKIATMKEAIGDFPLAIASGITPENVKSYLDKADCFLVATGISDTFSELDPVRVRELVSNVRLSDSSLPETHRGPGPSEIPSVCFICEWNEGRSVHLELSVRRLSREAGYEVMASSAGLSQGGRINPLRQRFLRERGVSGEEIMAHQSTLFSDQQQDADLILVSELQMKERVLRAHPDLHGRVMTVRGFLLGMTPINESLTPADAHIEDAAGHTDEEKLALYLELEVVAKQVVERLIGGAIS
jgi:protein-tyrosine-phosphatase